MSSAMERSVVRYLIGVDGGGTGTRLVLADPEGRVLARTQAGPSALALGAAPAWAAIEAACTQAFVTLGEKAGNSPPWSSCVLACGLAGVNHAVWRRDFVALAPPVRQLIVESDAYTALLGAHQGAPGLVIALGTGSIGAVLGLDGRCETVGGYGFPASDEASGAWLGLRAIQYAQYALDGRAPLDAYAAALLDACGASTRDALIAWLAAARQIDYASLAPIVLAHRQHPFVQQLLEQAGIEIGRMIAALDPSASLPVALTGGLAAALAASIPDPYQHRLTPAAADSAVGALSLAAQAAALLVA